MKKIDPNSLILIIFKHKISKDPGQFLLELPPLNRVLDVKRL